MFERAIVRSIPQRAGIVEFEFIGVTRFVAFGFLVAQGIIKYVGCFFDMRNVMIYGGDFLVDVYSFFFYCEYPPRCMTSWGQ